MQCQELNPPVPCKVHLPSLLAAVVAVLLAIVALVFAPPAVAADHSARLAKLSDDYFELRLSLFSLSATEDVGDPRFDGVLEIEISPDHRARQSAAFNGILKQLGTMPVAALTPADRLTYQVLKYDVSMRLEALKHPRHLLPVHQLEMAPVKLAGWAGGQSVQPFKTVQNYENYLKRLERLPLWNSQAIGNMREGMRTGVVQSRSLVERALEQLKTLAESGVEDSAYFSPIKRLPADFSPEDKARLAAAYREVLSERVLPSTKRLYAFVRDEYLPNARSGAGLGSVPGGDAWYRFNVRESTTTDLTAEQIHANGLKEVARIHREMETIKAKVGFDGPLFDFLKAMDKRADRLPFKTDDEVLAQFRAIDARVEPALSRLFGRAPMAKMEIRPVDPLIRDSASS
ncbi:MAG: DUF885 domain-containing protein, partial [Betaproteobacteria bacterium]|nr:DUF885 domain-containing protein [Betaproteobacteria bacterium]